MNAKERKQRRLAMNATVYLGSYGRCAEGHTAVKVTEGRDGLGRFLDVWCTAPGCKVPKQRLRVQRREVV